MAPSLDTSEAPSVAGESAPYNQDPVGVATPIAICGIACRLPGGVSTPSEFWEALVNKKDARCLVPDTRYNIKSFYSPTGKPGHIKTEYGYFLDESVDLGALDTTFFSMPKTEVERADPQQRLLLELTREALEAAGETDYRGKTIGTYVGSFGEDWLEGFVKDTNTYGLYKISGYGDFVLSNRLSYEYDLTGPSMTIRTGCSSALICLHEACMAIRAGECNAALVGGSNLIMAPTLTTNMSDQGVVSPNGSSRTFDAGANGYARGEAVNMLYIKKLSDAIRDGNPIRAVIRATSTNADGKTTGLTVPNFKSHEAMIRRAYEVAKLDYNQTGFVECHGTGTPTGDPIETRAVANVFGDSGVYIGSVKPNMGHSEGASGLTSLIKAVLALEHRTIPPNIKFDKPNLKIPFVERKLTVPTEPTPWPEDRAERASVNSFGIGGANAHVIVDSARSFLGDSGISTPIEDATDRPQLVVFTANTADSLRRQIVNQQKYIEEHPSSLANVAYTLGARRQHLPHRAFSVIGEDIEANTSALTKVSGSTPEVVMIFTGQGAQWPRMGAELLQSNSVFASAIRHMDNVLKTLPDAPAWSIEEELLKPAASSNLSKAYISQPLCSAIQIAMVDALAAIGVHPYAVAGHSSGEMAAAYASGKLTADEAIIAAYYRGVVSGEVTKDGAMAALGMGWDDASEFIVPGVVIACENSPSSVTISGDKDKVNEVLEAVRAAKPGVLARALKVDKAYHSHHMKEVGEHYNELASKYVHSTSDLPATTPIWFSSVTGKQLKTTDVTGPSYWRSNLESPVRFRTAVANFLAHHKLTKPNTNLVFLEVGPHSALAGPLRQTLAQASVSYPYASCLVRGKSAAETFLAAAGNLWINNVDIDFVRLTNPAGTARVVGDLPSYPWHHDHSYMFSTRIMNDWKFAKWPKHELLGTRIPESTDAEPAWRNVLLLEHAPWLRDHNIKGDVIFPCAGYVGMAGEVARQLCGGEEAGYVGFAMRNVVIDTAMVVTEGKNIEIVTSVKKARLTDSLDSAWYDFTVSSHNGSAWTRHAIGQVCWKTTRGTPEQSVSVDRMPRRVEASKWYQALRNVGANYGPYFNGLTEVRSGTTEKLSHAKVITTINDPEEPYAVHPTKIDFFLQLFSVAETRGIGRRMKKMVVPVFIEGLEMYKCDDDLDMTVEALSTARGLIGGGGEGVNAEGKLALRMKGVRLSPLEGDASEEDADPHAGARVYWKPDIDFQDIKPLVKPHIDQEQYVKLCQDLQLLCCKAALPLLEGIEPALPELKHFLRWMKQQPQPETEETIESLSAKLQGNAIADGVLKVFNNIVPIFKGEVKAIERLMDDNTLGNLYDFLNAVDRKDMFAAIAHGKPSLRILEIGAGTGGTSNAVLKSLVSPEGQLMYSSYTYTDISAGFFGAAKERFHDYPNMTFKELDITKDPLEQGFEAESFDLILAANVLHATPSLHDTLSNVMKLLHPEGRLYLEEVCADVKPFNYIMGVLPGWWLGVEEGRVDEPYITPAEWAKRMAEVGMEQEGAVLDCPTPNNLMAYMTAKPKSKCTRAKTLTLLHDAESAKIAGDVKTQLEAKGFEVVLHDLATGLPSMDTEKDIVSVLDLPRPYFTDINKESFDTFREMMNSASTAGTGIFWLMQTAQVRCKDPRWGQTIGATRTVRGELDIHLATCELDDLSASTLAIAADVFGKFHGRIMGDPLRSPEYEYGIVEGTVCVPRMYPVVVTEQLEKAAENTDDESALDLTIAQYGRLGTLQWTPRKHTDLVDDQVEVKVEAAGMNFKDVLIAMGIVETFTKRLGLEAAGVVTRVGPETKELKVGDRVFVLGAGCFSTDLVLTEKLCAKIPDNLSFIDAAGMPCIFGTVILGLLDYGRLQEGQSVLIHSACGGVGLASIQVAKMVGAEIYCTVGSQEKRDYLKEHFGIADDHIFHSRNASFLPDVLKATNGRGVDLVLNSLSGELLHASWDCVAEFGTMVEIGKRDLIGHAKLAMAAFELNRSYHGLDLGHLVELRPKEGARLLKTIVKHYEEGHLQPIRPVKTFGADRMEELFRFMQKGQHIGKNVVTFDVERSALTHSSFTEGDNIFKSDTSYLLAGGLGGLGRVASNWMIEHGARSLVYLSRHAGENAEDEDFFKELRSQGCEVTAVKGSVIVQADVERAINAAPFPVKGVLNMSMVLHDQAFPKMTHEEWKGCVDPKVIGTWTLHNATLASEKAKDLDFFVLFSSISGIVGQRGQANYASANTFLDSFVQYRHGLGLNAASIDIGLMLDHGYIAENPALYERLMSQGLYGIKTPQLLDAIAAVVTTPLPKYTAGTAFSNPSQLVIGIRSLTSLSETSNRNIWKGDRRMAVYHNAKTDSNEDAAAGASGATAELQKLIGQAMAEPAILDSADTALFVARQIAKQIYTLLLRPVENDEEIDVSQSLQNMGLDSLAAIEVRSWWKSTLGTDISVLEMLAMGSVAALGEKAVEGLKLRFADQEGGDAEGVKKFDVHAILETKMP